MVQKKKRNSKSDNKAKILKSAIRLIGENGVEGTSLSDIAKDVGISKGTLYYYYSTKSDIVLILQMFIWQRLQQIYLI